MSAVARPFGVTLVGILVVIAAIGSIIGSVLGLLDADVRAGAGLIAMIILLVIGLIYLALAKGIFDGNNFARLVIGFMSVIGLISGVYHLIFVPDFRLVGAVQIVYELIILGLLFNRRATAFFVLR